MSKKIYETKNICEVDLYDYRNLRKYPLYICLGKRNFTLGIDISDFPKKGYVKIESLQYLNVELRKHDFFYKDKYTEKILRRIQGYLD